MIVSVKLMVGLGCGKVLKCPPYNGCDKISVCPSPLHLEPVTPSI